jgi:hypothetical protein
LQGNPKAIKDNTKLALNATLEMTTETPKKVRALKKLDQEMKRKKLETVTATTKTMRLRMMKKQLSDERDDPGDGRMNRIWRVSRVTHGTLHDSKSCHMHETNIHRA